MTARNLYCRSSICSCSQIGQLHPIVQLKKCADETAALRAGNPPLSWLPQARGLVTAAEPTAELEVSVATARRDLEALSTAGIPVYPQPVGLVAIGVLGCVDRSSIVA